MTEPSNDDQHCADDPADFANLVERARAGDEQALGALLQDCRDYLLLIANQDLDGDVREKIGASDVVQETLFTAQAAIDQFRGNSRNEFLAWVRGILKNDLKDVVRHYKGAKKRQIRRETAIHDSALPRIDVPDHAKTPSTNAALEEEKALLEAAMARLSEEHRQVLQLRNWDKCSFVEIGEKMNRSEDAARQLWARAVVQLKRAMP